MSNLTNPNKIITVGLLDYFESKLLVSFKDVYIGKGVNYTSAMVAGNHHDIVTRGQHFNMTCNNSKVWVILRNTNATPVLMMTGIEIPLTAESDVIQDGITYKVYSSSNTYTGTFNIFLM